MARRDIDEYIRRNKIFCESEFLSLHANDLRLTQTYGSEWYFAFQIWLQWVDFGSFVR